MDEYERALRKLQELLRSLNTEDYTRISNPDSPDPDCLSVQTIMRHVISAGYGYATSIRKAIGVEGARPEIPLLIQAEAIRRLGEMFEYSLATFDGRWDIGEEEMYTTIIKTSWSEYHIDSLLEHAIVHILRHRRQIEKLVL
jgi:uncharacterized damage-inducible protein DinB